MAIISLFPVPALPDALVALGAVATQLLPNEAPYPQYIATVGSGLRVIIRPVARNAVQVYGSSAVSGLASGALIQETPDAPWTISPRGLVIDQQRLCAGDHRALRRDIAAGIPAWLAAHPEALEYAAHLRIAEESYDEDGMDTEEELTIREADARATEGRLPPQLLASW